MVAVVVEVTLIVVIVNVAVLAPAGTVTVDWTLADPMLEDSATTSPPGPATPFKVTTARELDPPTTEFGEREILATPAGTTPT